MSDVFASTDASRAYRYFDGPAYKGSDVGINIRHFTYETDAGLIAGNQMSITFTIECSAKEVWPCLRDFNRWQNAYGYYYSGVVGDLYTKDDQGLGEEMFRISIKKQDEPAFEHPYRYRVLRVVPERLIVIFQPVTEESGTGGISPGFHVFMLQEHEGKTTVTVYLEHSSRTQNETQEEALRPWREFAPEVQRFWRDIFIPNLKRLVHEDKVTPR